MMNIDNIFKTLDARSEELGIDIETRANLNAYFQSMKDISMDSELSFDLKKKKLELLVPLHSTSRQSAPAHCSHSRPAANTSPRACTAT